MICFIAVHFISYYLVTTSDNNYYYYTFTKFPLKLIEEMKNLL